MRACFIIAILLIISLFETGCYYDKEELLNPGTAICDTAIVTFSGSVKPILTANCTSCHSNPDPPLGVLLDRYSCVKAQAINGKLIGVITHSPGFIPMPQNAMKLSDCNIAKIKKWVSAGAPDN